MSNRIPKQILDLIPAAYVERHRVVPLSLEGTVLEVAHPAELRAGALRELSVLLGLEVKGVPEESGRLDDLIRRNYGVGAKAIESLVRTHEKLLADMRLAVIRAGFR